MMLKTKIQVYCINLKR